MVVEAGQVGWGVGDDVFVVDDAVDAVEFVGHELGEFVVADAGLAEVVDLCAHFWEEGFEGDGCDSCDGSSEGVACCNSGGVGVSFEEFCDVIPDLFFY